MENAKVNRNGNEMLEWILAGKAIFTIKNTETGNRFTYKVTQAKDFEGFKKNVWFVKVLVGPENTSDYAYAGTIFGESPNVIFRITKKSRMTADAPSIKVFTWLLENLAKNVTLPAKIEFWHNGRCARCGRLLTVPESVEMGIGPECAGLMGLAA